MVVRTSIFRQPTKSLRLHSFVAAEYTVDVSKNRKKSTIKKHNLIYKISSQYVSVCRGQEGSVMCLKITTVHRSFYSSV